MATLFAYTLKVSHYHPDDGAHDPAEDVHRNFALATSAEAAVAAARPYYGAAWEIEVTGAIEVHDGLYLQGRVA